MKISGKANGRTSGLELNNSLTASNIYAQRPLSIETESYGNHEKIICSPEKLNTADTPRVNAQAGTLYTLRRETV